MPESLPTTISAHQVQGKGTGLFTSKAFDAGQLVFNSEHPLVCIPDNEHLTVTCYNCFYLLLPADRSETDQKTLKSCNGCKVVKYCSRVS